MPPPQLQMTCLLLANSSRTPRSETWKLDVATQLQHMNNLLVQVMELQQNDRQDVSALRSQLLQWREANTSVGSDVAALRADMLEMALSQGTIMAALDARGTGGAEKGGQQQSQQQQQDIDATQKLLARARATPPHHEARTHADSHSQQQQRSTMMDAIEISPSLFPRKLTVRDGDDDSLPEARRLIADMSHVHKAVQRENARTSECNGDVKSARRSRRREEHTLDAQRNLEVGVLHAIKALKSERPATNAQLEAGERESERQQDARDSWMSKRPSNNDLKQAHRAYPHVTPHLLLLRRLLLRLRRATRTRT